MASGLWVTNFSSLGHPTLERPSIKLQLIAKVTLAHRRHTRHSYHCFMGPNMCKDFESSYIPCCANCQQNKSKTLKLIGLLHPLPVPDKCCNSMAIDFVWTLPLDDGYNCIMTFTDHLSSEIQFTHSNDLTGPSREQPTAAIVSIQSQQQSCPTNITQMSYL